MKLDYISATNTNVFFTVYILLLIYLVEIDYNNLFIKSIDAWISSKLGEITDMIGTTCNYGVVCCFTPYIHNFPCGDWIKNNLFIPQSHGCALLQRAD